MGPNMEKPEICEGGYVWRWWAWGPREGVAHAEPSWDCCPLIRLCPSLPAASLDGCQLGDRGGHGGPGRPGLGGRVLSALERDEVPFILFLSLEVPLRSDLNLSCC